MNSVKYDSFSLYHPLTQFLFFGFVLAFSMISMHPVCLAISCISGVSYLLCLKGRRGVIFLLRFALPVMLFAALINPLFNHRGVTVLGYLPGGNPLTLESIVYGISAGFMLAGVLAWFACFNEIITSDKLIYLLGRFVPVLSLMLSMILRFIPKFRRDFETAKEICPKERGEEDGAGRKIRFLKMKHAMSCFSIVVTKSLENSIETSDSLKSRGYGLRGRTSYSIYTRSLNDTLLSWFIAFCGLSVLSGFISGGINMRFYPMIKFDFYGNLSLMFYIMLAILEFMPVVLHLCSHHVSEEYRDAAGN